MPCPRTLSRTLLLAALLLPAVLPPAVLPPTLLADPALPNDEVVHVLGAHTAQPVPWDARAVRHLFNRAGFGLPERELAGFVARSPEEVVDGLLRGPGPVEPLFASRPGLTQYQDMAGANAETQRRIRADVRSEDRRQLRACTVAWVEGMVDHVDPLRDRMTLFWHGVFTTSSKSLRRNYELILQHQFVRANALGSYADLLAGIVRDPAMIYYLDNGSNQVGSPNENLARELMELFSLGEGNYSERDVQEVARALTGYTADREGAFHFDRAKHDEGEKEILGERGQFDGDDVVQILLRQPACAEWIAGRVIEYLEGVAPAPERRAEYAELLRSSGYELAPMLRALLLDPAFYRPEVVGTRVQGPVDFVVGAARRLGARPSAGFLVNGAATCGQTLFQPPNVKGWEEGLAWMTTSALLQRGNVAGLMLGVLALEPDAAPAREAKPAKAEPMDSMQADSMQPESMQPDSMEGESMEMGSMESMQPMEESAPTDKRAARASGDKEAADPLADLRKALGGDDYVPRVNLSWRIEQAGARTDVEIVDALLASLLAIDAPDDVRPPLLRFLRMERERLAIEEGRWSEQPELREQALRRLAHLILSLPEAQLS